MQDLILLIFKTFVLVFLSVGTDLVEQIKELGILES